MATLAEIARRAGVSPAVVSRVINKDKSLRVSDATRERVEAAVRDMHYSPNVAAQSLRSAKSGTLAVVVHDISNPVYGEILRGAQEEARLQSKAILLGDAAAGASNNDRLAQMIGGGGVDGLILQGAGVAADDLLGRAARQKVPIVLLQADMDIEASLIQLPNKDAALLAMQHLKQLGHQKIGCLATGAHLTFTQGRIEGWREAMGFDARDDLIEYADPLVSDGESATRVLLERNPDVTALFCMNVVSAIGALRAAKEMGKNVPDDLSIIAIHDVKFAQDLSVPLTVIHMPLEEMGRLAVRTVCDENQIPDKTLEPEGAPRLILRQSTAKPA